MAGAAGHAKWSSQHSKGADPGWMLCRCAELDSGELVRALSMPAPGRVIPCHMTTSRSKNAPNLLNVRLTSNI